MGLDSDLVGVIAACAIGGVCLCVVTIVLSCVCYRRLESKRRKEEKIRSNGNAGWAAFPPPFDHFHQEHRLGGYRPRILSPGSPGDSAIYNTASTQRGRDEGHGSLNQQTPGHHQSPSTSPHHSISTKANGHVLVRVPMMYPYGGLAHTQDFYDARPTYNMTHNEDMVETVYYPDQPYHSTLKTHQKVTFGVSPTGSITAGPAPDVPQETIITQNGDATDSHQQQNQKQQIEEGVGNGKDIIDNTQTDKTQGFENETNVNEFTGGKEDLGKEVNVHSSNYKVIKKQHNHTKMPDWMVREYGEQGESIDLEGEGNTAPLDDQEGVPGMVSVMVQDFSVKGSKTEQQVSDQHAMSLSTTEEGSASITHDYSSTNYIKDFSILDYVDPPGSSTADNQNNVVSSEMRQTKNMDAAILESKAAVLQQIREKVNESAEQMPPAFTSTPRVAPEVSELSNDDILARRQRGGNDGSVDALPPASDTNL